jgi:hypothetical protein
MKARVMTSAERKLLLLVAKGLTAGVPVEEIAEMRKQLAALIAQVEKDSYGR